MTVWRIVRLCDSSGAPVPAGVCGDDVAVREVALVGEGWAPPLLRTGSPPPSFAAADAAAHAGVVAEAAAVLVAPAGLRPRAVLLHGPAGCGRGRAAWALCAALRARGAAAAWVNCGDVVLACEAAAGGAEAGGHGSDVVSRGGALPWADAAVAAAAAGTLVLVLDDVQVRACRFAFSHAASCASECVRGCAGRLAPAAAARG